jgi:hypothetical protein
MIIFEIQGLRVAWSGNLSKTAWKFQAKKLNLKPSNSETLK